MKQTLATEEIQLTKSLGQNFLHDAHQLERIVAAAHLQSGDSVLEIGPGLGPLTRLLVEKARRVLAIEKDRRLFDFLERKFSNTPNLTLLCDDALDYLKAHRTDWSDWKLVANLPYSVGSPILVELALAPQPPQRLVATLQQEVVQRLAATADTDDYGILTLLVQLNFKPQGWFKIPASCFFPQPDVESACITLIRRPEPLLAPEEIGAFVKLVKRGFSQRRKIMFKLLKGDWQQSSLEAAYAELGLPAQIRAEKVTLEQFVKLARLLHAAQKNRS